MLTLAEVLAAQEAARSFPPLTDEQIRKVAALLSQPEVVVSVAPIRHPDASKRITVAARRPPRTAAASGAPTRAEIQTEMTTALARLRERVAQAQ